MRLRIHGRRTLRCGAVTLIAAAVLHAGRASAEDAPGETPTVETGREAAPPATPAPETPSAESRDGGPTALLPLGLAAVGVGAIGFGMFAGFGATSEAIYAGLDDRCGPDRCRPSDRADADAGKRQQTIANVGLVLGVTGVAVGTALLVTELLMSKRPSASVRERALRAPRAVLSF